MIYVHDDTGRITHSVMTADPGAYRELLTSQGESFVEVEGPPRNPLTHWVQGGDVVERSTFSVEHPTSAVVGQAIAISGVPAGTSVIVDDELMGVADGADVEASFDVPGTYRFTLRHWGFLTLSFSIVVGAAP